MKPSDLMFDIGRPVSYYPKLAQKLGGATATLLFCQLFYWQGKSTNELGVHKTAEALEAETGLSYTEQVTARKKLKALGVLIETHKRLEHRIYYKIDFDAFNALMLVNEGSEFAHIEEPKSGVQEHSIPEFRNPKFGDSANLNSGAKEFSTRGDRNPQSDLTENTTEITTENLSLNARASAPVLPEVQNAILTQRVPQVSSSLPSAFPMSLTWNPGPEFEKYARMLGLTNPAYSEAQLNEFRMYWEPTGRCFHHTQWIQKFVQRLKSDLARGLTNDQRNNNSSSRTGNRPASAGNSAWHRGLDAMRELLAEQGYLDEAAALGGSSDGYDSGYAPVRHSLASDASTFEQQGDAGRIYEGDYADFDRWEGDDQAD